MKHLFSPEGHAALAQAMARRPLLAFDFDGTLSPIVPRPDDARVPLAVSRRLERLCRLLPIAVISGRSIADVRSRLSISPQFIVGNHGAEDQDGHSLAAPPALFDPLRDKARRCRGELEAAGVTVEDKTHSLALHYRLSRDHEAARAVIAHLVEGLGPELVAHAGKRVLNVVAAQAPNKARALANVVARCGAPATVFVGEDLDDDPVSAGSTQSWLTVKIGRNGPATRTKFCLDDHCEVATMLDRILTFAP